MKIGSNGVKRKAVAASAHISVDVVSSAPATVLAWKKTLKYWYTKKSWCSRQGKWKNFMWRSSMLRHCFSARLSSDGSPQRPKFFGKGHKIVLVGAQNTRNCLIYVCEVVRYLYTFMPLGENQNHTAKPQIFCLPTSLFLKSKFCLLQSSGASLSLSLSFFPLFLFPSFVPLSLFPLSLSVSFSLTFLLSSLFLSLHSKNSPPNDKTCLCSEAPN